MKAEKQTEQTMQATEAPVAAVKKERTEMQDEVVVDEKDERAGIAYIFSSFNNTIIHITDLAGHTIVRVSGGMVTKQSRLKANPTTAMFVAKRAAEQAKEVGLTSLYVRTRAKTGSTGVGPGAHAAVKTLAKEGLRLISIADSTRVARGGPKKKGGKRGRRV